MECRNLVDTAEGSAYAGSLMEVALGPPHRRRFYLQNEFPGNATE